MGVSPAIDQGTDMARAACDSVTRRDRLCELWTSLSMSRFATLRPFPRGTGTDDPPADFPSLRRWPGVNDGWQPDQHGLRQTASFC